MNNNLELKIILLRLTMLPKETIMYSFNCAANLEDHPKFNRDGD